MEFKQSENLSNQKTTLTTTVDLDVFNQELPEILNFLPDAVLAINQAQKVIAWNHALEEMTGVKEEEIFGKGNNCYSKFFYEDCRPALIDLVGTVLDKRLLTNYEYFEQKGDLLYGKCFAPKAYQGKGAFLWLKAAPLYNWNGNRIGAIEVIRDFTKEKKLEGQILYFQTYDQLTGLYNRYFFKQELERFSHNVKNFPIGIIVLDIDDLKVVNYGYSYEIGDTVLISSAHIFQTIVPENGIIARIGGGSFGIILPQSSPEILEGLIRKIKDSLNDYSLKHTVPSLSVSAGFAYSDKFLCDISFLLREATLNMEYEKLGQNRNLQNTIIDTLFTILRERDLETKEHADRIQQLIVQLGTKLKLPGHKLSALRLLGQFHDIGKIGIPDRILLKKGPLTAEETMEMRRHCEIGYRIAQASAELKLIADWIYAHHEWWNGSGYPLGLQEEEIPLECRILAIADAYDAMTNDRPYRKALSKEFAFAELKRCAGTQFDPTLVKVFTELKRNENI